METETLALTKRLKGVLRSEKRWIEWMGILEKTKWQQKLKNLRNLPQTKFHLGVKWFAFCAYVVVHSPAWERYNIKMSAREAHLALTHRCRNRAFIFWQLPTSSGALPEEKPFIVCLRASPWDVPYHPSLLVTFSWYLFFNTFSRSLICCSSPPSRHSSFFLRHNDDATREWPWKLCLIAPTRKDVQPEPSKELDVVL